jgi:hypothetical protein
VEKKFWQSACGRGHPLVLRAGAKDGPPEGGQNTRVSKLAAYTSPLGEAIPTLVGMEGVSLRNAHDLLRNNRRYSYGKHGFILLFKPDAAVYFFQGEIGNEETEAGTG